MSINLPNIATEDLPRIPVSVVDDLVDLLRRERAAIARLDRAELESIAQGGTALIGALQTHLQAGGTVTEADRTNFSDAVRRLVSEAQINAVLLHDARTALSQMLGQPTGEGTYNARGHLSRAVRAIARGHI
jgi:hypothetical protein